MTNLSLCQSNRLLYAGPVATRRRFLTSTAAGLAAGLGSLPSWQAALRAQQQGNARHEKLLVTDIEVHNIMVPYEDWIHDTLDHFYGPSRRTIYIVRTNSELVGLGESHGPESDSVLNNYIGSSPWDWIGDETSLGLGTAMYDLMGKAAEFQSISSLANVIVVGFRWAVGPFQLTPPMLQKLSSSTRDEVTHG